MDSFFDNLPEYIELLMGYASPVFLVAIIFAVFIAYRKTQNETKIAVKTSDLLGLSYINVAEEMKETNPKDSALLGLLSGFSTWAMKGTYNNVPVHVELTVKGQQRRYIAFSDRVNVSNPTKTSFSRGTEYTALFDNPLPFDINIQQNIQLPFNLSGANTAETIETGDPDLDRLVSISGKDKAEIQKWLKTGRRRGVLKNLFQALPAAYMNSSGLFFRDNHSKADYDHLKNKLTLLSKAIQTLKVIS